MSIQVAVNGDPRDLPDGTTVAEVVAAVTGLTTGVAAAVNGEVVPLRSWHAIVLGAGDRVEVVTAVQGG